MEEEFSKFPIIFFFLKTLKRQSKCHVFVKQVCFSYGESPRTPPLEGTSLHRRNISVERPWGILSLFTTCLPLWVNSANSLFKKKKKKKKKKEEEEEEKKTLTRQSKCHVFVKQVCFSYGESPRTPPLEGTSLHRRNISVERPWGILSLFTTCLPLWVKSSRQSRCHVSPTQELMACILRRQSNAGKDGTRKKCAAEEDPRKSPEKNFKNEPPEQLKSAQSLKRERNKNKHKKELSV